MKIKETKIKIGDLYKGFDKSKFSGSDEDVMCYEDKLNCRPAYQRNYVYGTSMVKTKDGKTITKKEQVINTIFKGYPNEDRRFPMSIMYWQKMPDGTFQILDGQQRTLSALLFRAGDGTLYKGNMYVGLQQAEKDWFNNYEFTVYICEKDDNQTEQQFEAEVLEWFDVINIAGEPLTPQELRNATYFGSWLSSIKEKFSNTESEIFKEKYNVEKYIKFDKNKMNRQEFLETILRWRSDSLNKTIEEYMSEHRADATDTDLFNYFVSLLNWIKTTFPTYRPETRRSDWGYIYNKYHDKTPVDADKKASDLFAYKDEIDNPNSIYEAVLSGDMKLLNSRTFDKNKFKSDFKRVYEAQHHLCPYCKKEFELNKLEADHIKPWSKGGTTTVDNLQLLCKTCNIKKSNYDNSYSIWDNKEYENFDLDKWNEKDSEN